MAAYRGGARSVLACLLVLVILIAPGRLDAMTPSAFLRVPVEALLVLWLVLLLRARGRRAAASAAGVSLGLHAKDLGYQGLRFSFATMPDQYTLAAFQRLERATPNRAPVMAEIPLILSHAPWSPIPQLVDCDKVGDGSSFDASAGAGDPSEIVLKRDPARVKADFAQAINYSLSTLISYVQTYGDDNLVLIVLGDEKPAQAITGKNACHDVPINIIPHDPRVLDRVGAWGWQDGLQPDPHAPVWRMDTFRDRFLTAFGS